jgi:hypothetical protein
VTCERIDVGDITIFFCGPRPKAALCSRCKLASTATCATCGALLCGDHARRLDAEIRCATHAANLVTAGMPRPPGRPR